MQQYIKKQVIVEAIQYNNLNREEIEKFVGKKLKCELESEAAYLANQGPPLFSISIETKEGLMKALPTDWIIKEPFPTGDRDFYPCKNDIFEKTYDKAEPTKFNNDNFSAISTVAAPFEANVLKPVGKVYPSEEETIFSIAQENDEYGGAHIYMFRNNLGFSDGKSNYAPSVSTIRFVEKKQNGEIIPGIQSEQLVIALIDRIKKLNAKFPCDENDEQVACLEGYLAACKKRIDNRINRGVMGDLKK